MLYSLKRRHNDILVYIRRTSLLILVKFEDPLEILKQMEAGVNVVSRKKCITIADRKEAIKTAVSLADKEDIILVAGKGHEKYQEINGVKYDFDDKDVLNEMFELLEK